MSLSMKVIKKIKPKPPIVLYRGNCNNCNCELEANKDELDVDLDNEGILAFGKCIECGEEVRFFVYKTLQTRG